MMNVAYGKLWKVKLNIYKRTNNQKDLKDAKAVGKKRIEAGENCFVACNCCFPVVYGWWIYLDFVKMELQLFNNFVEAATYAATMLESLISQRDSMEASHMFCEKLEIPYYTLSDRKIFLYRIIQFCKKPV